jgi:hypothetical protein
VISTTSPPLPPGGSTPGIERGSRSLKCPFSHLNGQFCLPGRHLRPHHQPQ